MKTQLLYKYPAYLPTYSTRSSCGYPGFDSQKEYTTIKMYVWCG